MENTLENKAKFFAIYFKQRVLRTSLTPEVNPVATWTLNNLLEEEYLELKPLSSITDEDHEIITEIKNSKNLIGSIPKNNINATYLIQEQVDYLRSKGYALPWMGLSVEQLQEYGWIKLKSE